MFKILTLLFTSIALLLTILLLPFWKKQNHISIEETSGAYEALNFLSQQRTYPYEHLPEEAYFAAWNEAKKMLDNEKNNPPTDPWTTMGPHNRGGRTLALEINPQNDQTLWVGSASGGLWRSYTGGHGALAWDQVDTGFPILGVSSIAFAPGDSTVMYIGTGEVYNVEAAGTGAAFRRQRGSYGMGILKSVDGGATWEISLDWTYNQERGIWMIKVSPLNPNLVYAATTEGVYRSIDAGANWEQIHDIAMVTDILVHPENDSVLIASCGNFASTGFGIYKTVDAGASWTKITSSLPTYYEGKTQLAAAPSDPDIVYASIGNGFSPSQGGASWLCRSEDFGTSWTVQTTQDYSRYQGWFSHDVAVSPTNPNVLTVIGINVWRSINGGVNLLNGGSVHVDCHDVKYHPTDPAIVYVVSDGGVYCSENGGGNFQELNGGYQTAQFYNGFSNSFQDSTVCIGGLQDNGTIVWDGALSWNHVFGGDGSWTAIDPNNDNIVFASSQYLNMGRSTNGPAGFSSASPAGSSTYVTAFIAPFVIGTSNSNVLYAGRSVVYKTMNQGQTWTATNGGAELDGNPVLSMEVSPQNTDVVYAGTAPSNTGPGLFVTTDGGDNWIDVTGDLPNRFPMDVTVDPTNEAIAYVVYSGFNTGHVFRTTDYGGTWTDITGNLPDVPTNAVIVDPIFPNNIYVGNDLGVFASVDDGNTWEAYQDGLPRAVMVFDLKISPSNRKLRIATHGNGAFQRNLLEMELVAVEDPLGKELALMIHIFPNPASSQTRIQYELAQRSQVKLQLLDTKGRIIKSIFNGSQNSGSQEIDLNISDLPAGSYLVQLVAEEQVSTRKLVVY